MKYKTLTLIIVCASLKANGQIPTTPGIPIPQQPQPATLAPQVIVGFPNPHPQTANPFAPNANIQRQNEMIMLEVQQHEQRRLQQQQLLAEIERDMRRGQVQYELPDLSTLPGTEHYRQAFEEISQMLEGKQPLNLKRAVFLVENAYHGNQMNYDWLNNDIGAMIETIQAAIRQEGLSPENDIVKKWMLHRFMSDTLQMKNEKGEVYYTHMPYAYDFDDPFGKTDWTKMFVTKLVQNGKGQCHSLPLLYLILAEQLGVEAYLSYSPEHTFIRVKDEKGRLYNLELTNGRYSSDSWILGSGYIKAEALKNKLYMDTLGKREVVAACLFDLAKGYSKKYGYDKFILQCTEKGLEQDPNNIFAMQLYSDYHTLLFHHVVKQLNFPKLEVLQQNYPRAFELYLLRNQIYDLIDQSGFETMTEEAYMKWLNSFETQAANQPKQIIRP